MRSVHVNAELEENLGMIEEITNYLKVLRSYPLTSLKFLKNLKVIHGDRLYSERSDSTFLIAFSMLLLLLLHFSLLHTRPKQTRSTLDCDQSNYSSCIDFSYIPIEFVKPETAPFDPPTPP